MTWFTESANQTEAASEHVHMFIAVAMDFTSGFLRCWSGFGDLSFGGYTYTGTGNMGTVSVSPDHTRLLAEKKSYRISGVDPSIVSEADIDACFGRSVTEYFGFLDANGVLVATPETNWEGRIDSFSRVDSAEPYIEVTAENRMVLLDLPNGWRYTHEHQDQFFANDTGLKLVPTTMTAEVLWGDRRVTVGLSNGGSVTIPSGGGLAGALLRRGG